MFLKGGRNVNKADEGNSSIVCYVSIAAVLAVIIVGVLYPEAFIDKMTALFDFLSRDFNWIYLGVVTGYVVFLLYLALSKYGSIKLGPDDSEPEFSLYSWIAMLFSISLGVGIIFFGVQEPLYHYLNSPRVSPDTPAAAVWSMKTMFLHWGIHPWAVYAFTGLGLAYFSMKRGLPLLISSMLEPVLRGKSYRRLVEVSVDTWIMILTVTGIASAFGMACSQITAGMHYAVGTPNNFTVFLLVVVFMTFVYVTTALTGVEKGIKIVSDINLAVALFFLASMFCLGPTTKILQIIFSSLSNYLQNIVGDSLLMDPFDETFSKWHQWWTVFYWAWWCSWGAFCGIFIARISKGRTIRQFVFGVMGIPPIILFIWFSTFGGSGLELIMNDAAHILRDVVINDRTSVTFAFLGFRPFTHFWYWVVLFLLFTFELTSANSGAWVMATLSSNGDTNPPKKRILIWSIIMSATAAIIYRSGGISGLQMAALCVAFPYLILTAVAIYAMMKEFVQVEAPKLREKNNKALN